MGKNKQKQLTKEQERRKLYSSTFFHTVATLKIFAKNPLQIKLQNLRESLAKAPQALRTNPCRSALHRACTGNREDVLHILNEAGILFALMPPGADVPETALAVKEEDMKKNFRKPSPEITLEATYRAFCFLARAAELPHNVLNEQLRAATTGAAVDALLRTGAKPNYYGSYECTAVHEAAYSRRPDCLLALLKNGGNNTARTAEGRTPLHAAAIGGDATCVLILLNAGVDVEAADYCSMTALHFAAGSARSAGCVPILLTSGADVNKKDKFEMTPLHYAAAYGTEETVKILLKAGADPQTLNLWHQTAGDMVFSSCETPQRKESRASVYHLLNLDGHEAGDMDIVEEFIWDEDQPLDRYGRRKGNTVHVVRQLARDSDSVKPGQVWSVLTHDKSLLTTYSMCKALQACAEDGKRDVLRGLMNRGANPNARESLFWTDEVFKPVVDPSWLTCDRADWPLIHLAAAGGHIESVEVLEQAGASLQRVWVLDHSEPFGPLEAAAANGHLAVAKLLLVAGCVKDREQLGGALRLAVTPDSWQEDVENWKEELQLKLARTLLDAGADPNAQDVFGHTAIMGAACTGWSKCLSLLMRRGGDVLTETRNGTTALHIAARGGHSECVRALIEAGAHVSSVDCAGQTPFHYAAEGRTDGKWAYTPWLRPNAAVTIEHLLRAGADMNAVDGEGATALHLAAAAPGSQAVVEMLLRMGACINAKDRDGRTPLHYAAEAGVGAAVEHLLRAGADPDARDLNDCTPRDGAKWNTAQLLRPNASKGGEKEEVKDDDWSGGSWAGDSNEDELEEILSTEEEDSEWDEDDNSADETCSEVSESYHGNEDVCNPGDRVSGGGQDVESEQDEEDSEEEEEEEEEDEEVGIKYRLRSRNPNQSLVPNVSTEVDDTWKNWSGWKGWRRDQRYDEHSITKWLRSLRPKETNKESLGDNQLINFMPAQVMLDRENANRGPEQVEGQDIKSKECEPRNDIPQQRGEGVVGSSHHIRSEEVIQREGAGDEVGEMSACIQENRITSSEPCRQIGEKQQTGEECENVVQYPKREEQNQESIFSKIERSSSSNVSVRSGEQEKTHRGDYNKSEENNKRNKVEEYDNVIDRGLLCSYERRVEGSSDSIGHWENDGSHERNREDMSNSKGGVSRPSVWSRLERRPSRSNAGGGLSSGLIVTRILKDDGQPQRYIQQNSSGGRDMERAWDTVNKQDEDKWQINSSQSRSFRDGEKWERSDGLEEVGQDENQGNWSVQCVVNEQDERYVNEKERCWGGQEESCEVGAEDERIVYIEDGSRNGRSRNEWARSDELGRVWDRQECAEDGADEWEEQQRTGENGRFEVREWKRDREDEWDGLTREESLRKRQEGEGEGERGDREDQWGCGGEKGKTRQRYDDSHSRYSRDDEEERTVFHNTSKYIAEETEHTYHEQDVPDPDHMGRRSRERRLGIHDHDSNSGRSEFSGRGKSWDRQSDRQSRESWHRAHESKVSEFSRQGGSWERYDWLDRRNEEMDRRSREQGVGIHDIGRSELSSRGKSWDRQSDRSSRESRHQIHESRDSEFSRQGGSWDRHNRLGRISEERGQENYEREHYPEKEERYCQRKSNERDIGGSYGPPRSCEREYGRPRSQYSGSSKQEHDRAYSRYGSSEQEHSRHNRPGAEDRGRSRSPLVWRDRLREEPRKWGRQETKENRNRLDEWERSRRPVEENRFQDHSRRREPEEHRRAISDRHGSRERVMEKEDGGYRRTSAPHERYSPHKRFFR